MDLQTCARRADGRGYLVKGCAGEACWTKAGTAGKSLREELKIARTKAQRHAQTAGHVWEQEMVLHG